MIMQLKTQGQGDAVGAITRGRRAARFLKLAFVVGAIGLTAETAVWVKRGEGRAPILAAVAELPKIDKKAATTIAPARKPTPDVQAAFDAPALHPEGTKFFDGRPLRVAKVVMMTVTAYSPDWRSCGEDAQGITASTKSVYTNGGRMVAADTRVLPMNSMITVPGYSSDEVVPVLDRGGAIKGNRLDVLFPTHEQAMQWGVQKLPVVVWEFADEAPAKRS